MFCKLEILYRCFIVFVSLDIEILDFYCKLNLVRCFKLLNIIFE